MFSRIELPTIRIPSRGVLTAIAFSQDLDGPDDQIPITSYKITEIL